MATKKKPAPAAKASTPMPPAETAASQAENLTEAATAAPPAQDAPGGVESQTGEASNGIGEGVQVDGQGLPPVSGAKTHLRVAARVDGFRRCGRAWPASGDTVAKSAFTADQVARLLTDPDLVVTEVDGE